MGIAESYQPPRLTEEQLRKYAQEYMDHGIVYVVYTAGQATVLSFSDVYVSDDPRPAERRT